MYYIKTINVYCQFFYTKTLKRVNLALYLNLKGLKTTSNLLQSNNL